MKTITLIFFLLLSSTIFAIDKKRELTLSSVFKKNPYAIKAQVLDTSKKGQVKIKLVELFEGKKKNISGFKKGATTNILYIKKRDHSKPIEQYRPQYKRELIHFFLNKGFTYIFFKDPSTKEPRFFAVKLKDDIEFKVKLFLQDSVDKYYAKNRSLKKMKEDLTDYDLYKTAIKALKAKKQITNDLIIAKGEKSGDVQLIEYYLKTLSDKEKNSFFDSYFKSYKSDPSRAALYQLSSIASSLKSKKQQLKRFFQLWSIEKTKENMGQSVRNKMAQLCEDINLIKSVDKKLFWDFVLYYLEKDRYNNHLRYEAFEKVYFSFSDTERKKHLKKVIETSIRNIKKERAFAYSLVHVIKKEAKLLSPKELFQYIKDVKAFNKSRYHYTHELVEVTTKALAHLSKENEIDKDEIKEIAKFYNKRYIGRTDREISKQLKELADQIYGPRDSVYFSAAKNRLKVLGSMLRNGFDPNKPQKGGFTALMVASQQGHIEAVKLLVKHGAKIETRNDYDMSALDYAVNNEREDIVKFLRSKTK